MNVALIFDDVAARAGATADEMGVLEAVAAVEQALATLGHRVVPVAIGGRPRAWCERIEQAHADLVFNLCEGVNGSSALEPHVAAVIELLGLPLTGSGSATLALARRKDHVNAILAACGIAVPEWRVISPEDPVPGWHNFPAIVKPAAEDASIGITQDSVVRDAHALARAVADGRRYGALLVQEYVSGRELNAGIVGDDVLPLAEIDFSGMPSDAWPIVSYRAKWETGSAEDLGSVPVCPAPLNGPQATVLAELARRAWRAVGGAGYGRVDFRITEDGSPRVLEVNPNPDLAPSAGLARMGRARGWSFEELVARIIAAAGVGARPATQAGRSAPAMAVP